MIRPGFSQAGQQRKYIVLPLLQNLIYEAQGNIEPIPTARIFSPTTGCCGQLGKGQLNCTSPSYTNVPITCKDPVQLEGSNKSGHFGIGLGRTRGSRNLAQSKPSIPAPLLCAN